MSNLRTLDAAIRSDFASFVHKVFDTLNPGVVFHPNWHIDAMSHVLDQVGKGILRRQAIAVPPRSLKSLQASIALPAFILGNNPGARIICVSHSTALSSKLARDFRKIINSDWYRRVFPDVVLSKETEDMVETTKGGARLSTSIGASVTGFGAEIIIIDDPMKPDEAPSEAVRESVKHYYDQVLYTRLDSKQEGRIVLVMQRLHEDDLCGHLLGRGGWTCLSLPAIATAREEIDLGNGRKHTREVGDVLHPAREPLSVLEELRHTLGGAGFEAQYQQAPVPATGNMVKTSWLLTYKQLPDREKAFVTQSWDTATKGNPKNDFSVCTTWLEREGKHYLMDVFREQLDFPDLIKATVAQHAKHMPDAILIEDHGSGISLIQQLRTQPGLHPIGIVVKQEKIVRLSTVLPMIEGRQVFFPEDAHWLPMLQKELLGFPNTKFDDQVDSVTQYLAWIRDRIRPVFQADFGIDETPNHDEIAMALLSQPRPGPMSW